MNKVRQVLINVIGNAVKFTGRGGIAVRVYADRPAGEGAAGCLRVEVEDTGSGISADDQRKLFRHFEQTQAGQLAGTGTGLGLAISREFARLMGGEITVTSVVDRGSVFVIRLPFKDADAGAAEPEATAGHVLRLRPGGACRVLIVDDVEDNRQLLAELLGPVGFDVRLAADGAEAVAAFQAWRPDLILMDFRMPVMDGHEAIRRIRALPGGGVPKIIAVTASAMDENRRELLDVGADDFIGKPFREPDLFEKIRGQAGVEYVYAADGPPAHAAGPVAVTPASLAGCPAALLTSLREAVLTADLDLMLARIMEVDRGCDPGVAAELRRLAEGYEYQALLDLLSTGAPVELAGT